MTIEEKIAEMKNNGITFNLKRTQTKFGDTVQLTNFSFDVANPKFKDWLLKMSNRTH